MIVSRKTNRAFSLIEVTLALGVAGFCLIALFGLLSTALNSDRTSTSETEAVNILSSVVADLRQTPNPAPVGTTADNSPVYLIPVPAAVAGTTAPTPAANPGFTEYLGEDGQIVTSANDPKATYRMSVWATPGAGRGATLVRVMLSWPPPADLTTRPQSVETVVALDRN